MNIKVVVVWGIAILLFFTIGLFGYFNRDLLDIPENDKLYVPTDPINTTVACTNSSEIGDSFYRFTLNDDKSISKVYASHTVKNASIDAYSAASNLNNSNINGIVVNLSGSSTEFTITINADLNMYDANMLETYSNDLKLVNIYIDKITNLEDYKIAINSNGISYNCE